MKIKNIQVFHANGGWRPWTFVKITSSDGIEGWSECTDSHGSPKGVEGVINDLSNLLIDKDPREINKNRMNPIWAAQRGFCKVFIDFP